MMSVGTRRVSFRSGWRSVISTPASRAPRSAMSNSFSMDHPRRAGLPAPDGRKVVVQQAADDLDVLPKAWCVPASRRVVPYTEEHRRHHQVLCFVNLSNAPAERPPVGAGELAPAQTRRAETPAL